MKEINKGLVMAWSHDPTKMPVARTTAPTPFPGRWPTRVWLVVVPLKGERWEYLGKPAPAPMNAFRRLAKQPLRYLRYAEFDRTGFIACDKFRMPRGVILNGEMGLPLRPSIIYNAYHPHGLQPGSIFLCRSWKVRTYKFPFYYVTDVPSNAVKAVVKRTLKLLGWRHANESSPASEAASGKAGNTVKAERPFVGIQAAWRPFR